MRRVPNDLDVLIFTCSMNELCHGTGMTDWDINGMNKSNMRASLTETVYQAIRAKLIEFVDEVTNKSETGNLHVLAIGGRAASWDTGAVAVSLMW